MKKILILALLLIPALAGAQDFKHRYFHYNQYFDTTNPFVISANTIDGADTGVLSLTGGGARNTLPTGTRGAGIDIGGNEDATYVGRGILQLYTGDSASSLMTFSTNGNTRLTIPYLADTDNVDLILGKAGTAAPVFTIRAQTADGDDDGILLITPGGDATATRGAYIRMEGADEGGANLGGSLYLVGGSGGSASDIALETGNVGADILLRSAGNAYWTFDMGDGGLYQNATNGGNIVMAKANTGLLTGIAARHADISGALAAPDNLEFGQVPHAWARGTNDSNGPYLMYLKSRATDGSADVIVLNGDKVASNVYYGADGVNFKAAAQINVEIDGAPAAGTDMPGRIVFLTTPDGSATPAERWRIESDGDLFGNATTGGDIDINRPGYGINEAGDSRAATGADQAGALLLYERVAFVTGADGAVGVKMPGTPPVGAMFHIYNTANAVLKVYPNTGDQINAAGANTAVDLAAYGGLVCHAQSTSQWWCMEGANP